MVELNNLWDKIYQALNISKNKTYTPQHQSNPDSVIARMERDILALELTKVEAKKLKQTEAGNVAKRNNLP
jgi:hypothetical protein